MVSSTAAQRRLVVSVLKLLGAGWPPGFVLASGLRGFFRLLVLVHGLLQLLFHMSRQNRVLLALDTVVVKKA